MDDDDDPITFRGFSKKSSTIKLSGGRTYQFPFGDFTKLMLWSTGSPVTLEKSEDENYPILIQRVDHDEDNVVAKDPTTDDGLPEDWPD